MSKQPMLSNCKRHTKLTNSSNNCRKRVSGTFNDTQRYSLSSLAEEAGSGIPSECQRRSIASVPRKTNNNCKRRSCEPQNDRCQVSEKECAEMKSNSQEIPEKNPAFRQSSYPGLRERTLIQNESKRHSMPLPLIYKKEMMNKVILSQNKISDHVVEITDTVRCRKLIF
jgi:hypothetical protein